MRKTKQIISLLLCVCILMSMFAGFSFTAQAEEAAEPSEYYTYNILVRTVDDADDWNGATLTLHNSKNSNVPDKEWNIMSNIDDAGEEFKVSYDSSYFYDEVKLHIDFGGNIAIHSWTGTFTVDINGKSQKIMNINESSGIWSSKVATYTHTFEKPYPVSFKYYSKDENLNKVDAVKIYQDKADTEGTATGSFYIQVADQYATQWKDWSPDTVKFTTGTSSPITAVVENPLPKECKVKVQCTGGQNIHDTIYFSCSNGGDGQLINEPIDCEFFFWRNVTATAAEHGTLTISDKKAYVGDTVTVNATPNEGYYFDGFTVTDANGGDVAVTDGKFTMPDSNVTVTANFVPITYTAKFVIDGKIVAEVPYNIETTSITEPEVPEKAGYDGTWKPYKLTIGGVTVEAKYEQIIHEFRVSSSTPATCTSEGYDTYTCIYCGETYNKTTTPVKAHQFVSTGFTAPTCTEAGYQTYECLNCDATYTGDYINAKGHSFVADVVAPTCTEEGYTTYTCEVCGAERTRSDGSIYKTNITKPVAHTYKVTSTVSATCTTEGYDTYTCTVCGDTYNKTTTSALTHEWRLDKWTNDETDHWHVCTRCDEVLDKQAHNYGEVTYTWDGTDTVTASHTCQVCGYVESESVNTVSEMTKEPTCTVKGETTYVAFFTIPAFEMQEVTLADIAPLGHDWVKAWSRDAKSHWHICTRCDAKGAKAAHNYGSKGNARFTCSVCGYVDSTKKKQAEKADKELAYEQFVAGLKAMGGGQKVTVKWGKVKNADRYVIYATYCGLQNKFKQIGTAGKNATSFNITKLNGKKLNLKKNVKLYVVAQKKSGGKYVKIFESPSLHVAGTKSNNTSIKQVKVAKNSFTLGTKGKAKIKPSLVYVYKYRKPLSHVPLYRYLSSNTAVVKVDKNGNISAAGKGTATVLVYSQNGYPAAVKVTVK